MITTFHLKNREANKEISVHFCGEKIKNEKTPVYLGITLNRRLSFKTHLLKVSAKFKTRIGLINKLAGITWGAATHTLRTSSLALTYSVAEYCASVWAGSAHTEVVDIQLRKVLRTISGTVLSTKEQWLPYLASIEPPHIRRQNSELPIHEDGIINPRLKSRKSFLFRARIITEMRENTPDVWQAEWQQERAGGIQIDNVRTPVLGMNLPRKTWVRLNIIRTGQGRCNELMHKWKFVAWLDHLDIDI
ncbi:hypothetical protein QTP88_012229 [Uroleucon formosanum]